MIVAQLMSGGAGAVQAKFLFEGGKELTTGNFKSIDEVALKVNFLNRDHMVGILVKWLKQRHYAMGNSDNREYPMYLVKVVEWHKDVPFKEFMRVIRENRRALSFCIPGVNSRCYNYYNNEIKPWLNHCLGVTGD